MAGSTNDIALVPMDPSGMVRPNPVLWIWYTLGGRLGPAYRGWVLHDTTCRTRWLRQIVRVVVQVVLPAAVVLAVLGVTGLSGPRWVWGCFWRCGTPWPTSTRLRSGAS